jgi:dipeptidyl aminopeptidase/acylaminoacyl peptidase
MLKSVLLSLGLCMTGVGLAAEPRAITHEDLWLLKRVSPPVVSPDGRFAIVSVLEPSYDEAQNRSDLWLVPTDGSAAPRRLTATRAPETGTVFSPDSRRIAFSTARDGDTVPQIWVLDLAGGEALRATSLSTGALAPVFSPDGERLAFVSSVFPESANDADSQRIAAERAARKANVRIYEGFPIRYWDRWLDGRQIRPFVQVIGESTARDLLAGTELVKSPGYGGRQTDTGEMLDLVFTPDGKEIVFNATVNRDRGAWAWTHADLYAVPVAGGEPRRLTGSGDEAGDNYSRARFSPDGRTLYALTEPRTERVYNATRLAVLEWPALTRLPNIAAPDGRAIGNFVPGADGRSLWLQAETDGHDQIYSARRGDTVAKQLSQLTEGVYNGLAGGGDARKPQLLALWESAASPAELVRIDPERGTHTPLTRFNAEAVAKLDLPKAEHFWFQMPDGRRIHNLLVRPAGFDSAKRYPLFALIHGGPHIMWRDQFFLRWNYHLLAGSDTVLLLTNYKGSTGFGEAFAQSIQGDPLKGPADEINAAADAAIARYAFIDGERQCAGGASYGGHLANWLQGTTTRYRCLVSHAGLVNLEAQWATSDIVYSREAGMGGPPWAGNPLWAEQNPVNYAEAYRTPVLVTIGELDYRVPLNNVLEYWTVLQRQRVPSRLVVFPDENHWILKGENSRVFYAEVRDWLRKYLQ